MSEVTEEQKAAWQRAARVSNQLIDELDALSDAVTTTTVIAEKDFEERAFPIRYNRETHRYEFDENEVRKFYEDPENISRTVYCKQMNKDDTDGWGMFGYTPGFFYIVKKNHEGTRTLADQAAGVGLSIGVDPNTGLGLMNHQDYFPVHKFSHQSIKRTEFPDLFNLICDIFAKKKLEGSHGQALELSFK